MPKYFVYSIPALNYPDGNYIEGDNSYCFKNKYQTGWRKMYYQVNNQKYIALLENFKNGKLNGNTKGYYLNGNLMFEGQYKDDARINKWTTYYSTGEKMSEINYIGAYLGLSIFHHG